VIPLLPASERVCSGHATHAVADSAPTAVENVSAAHGEHPAEPLLLLYVPASHAAHSAPSGPV
jgi:hypothetical protein